MWWTGVPGVPCCACVLLFSCCCCCLLSQHHPTWDGNKGRNARRDGDKIVWYSTCIIPGWFRDPGAQQLCMCIYSLCSDSFVVQVDLACCFTKQSTEHFASLKFLRAPDVASLHVRAGLCCWLHSGATQWITELLSPQIITTLLSCLFRENIIGVQCRWRQVPVALDASPRGAMPLSNVAFLTRSSSLSYTSMTAACENSIHHPIHDVNEGRGYSTEYGNRRRM